MALLESGRPPRDILPPINHPDLEKSRLEKNDHPRFSMMPGLSISTAPLENPTTAYSGPPPPYSSTSSIVEGISSYFSPPHSTTRRSTRDEKDLPSAKQLPSLPSLHEALGGDKPISFPGPLSAPQSAAPGSTPATAVGQSFPDAPRGPPNPFLHTSAPPPPLISTLPHSDVLTSKPVVSGNIGPEHPGYISQPFASSPQTNGNTHRSSAGSLSSITRPYEPPNNNPSYPADSTTQNTQYRDYPPHPPAPQPAPSPFHFDANGKFDNSRNPFPRRNSHISYGDTVKRHLDSFDADLAINEVYESSTRTFEFSRAWQQRHHQGNRASHFVESAPSLQEIDDIMRHQQRILENLTRIREMVVVQQTLLSEERARVARGHMEDEYHNIHDEYKAGGFAGGDAKKRRGKAAPPGRCHSCNRAETPEWRRGPDGARTLCNACGLHYAKLTRKLGANKASSLTGSSLRPKNLDQRPTHV